MSPKFKKNGVPGRIIVGILAVAILLIIIFHHNPLAEPDEELVKKILGSIIDIVTAGLVIWKYDSLMQLIRELLQNRRLIWKLSKNDFKTKYAGSYLGVVWAFVQPIITILMYWFIFDVLMQTKADFASGGDTSIPFVLYLTAGLVPWFYFSEALSSGTSSFRTYNYLVKKVVFKVSILPIIRVIGSTFVHLAFIGLVLILNMILGNWPSIYWVQIIYYSFCMFVFSLALTYATSSIVVFFKDLTQIISIVLQVGIWSVPIMWNISLIPERFHIIIKLNPIFYIVNGYRTALYGNKWFWEDFYSTVYFWIVTIIFAAIGILIFKRLKPHFADVL
jgi:teichoic acid transport system permease protein